MRNLTHRLPQLYMIAYQSTLIPRKLLSPKNFLFTRLGWLLLLISFALGTIFICIWGRSSYQAIQKLRKNAPAFCSLSFCAFWISDNKKDWRRAWIYCPRKIKSNQVFEYSNNDGENVKQLPSYLAYRGENKVIPQSMGSKNALVSV